VESMGDCYAVILNDSELCRGLICDADSSGRSAQAANSSEILQQWFAHALHGLGLATRVDPASQAVGLTPAPAGQELARAR